MSAQKKTWDLTLYSIGHSNHTVGEFVSLLQLFDIACIIDVRSVPYSKYNKQFTKEDLEAELLRSQLEYIWMGDSLGGRRLNLMSDFGFREDDKYIEDKQYRAGLVELMRKGLRKTTAIMCSEEDPRDCHRHKIITQSLLLKKIPECDKLDSIKILHIRGNGKAEDALSIPFIAQPPLF